MRIRRCSMYAGFAGWPGPVFLLSLLIALNAGAAEIKPPQTPFSAYMTFRSGKNLVMEGPLWYAKGRERRQMSMQGRKMTFISRSDKNAVYIIEPTQKMAMQMKMQPGMRYYDNGMMARLNPKRVGKERVAGEDTVKYRVNSAKGTKDGFDGHIWVTGDGIVMKLEGKSLTQGQATPMSMRLKDVKRGPVAPNLFEIPPGYRVMKMN